MEKNKIVTRLSEEDVDAICELLKSEMEWAVDAICCGYTIEGNVETIRQLGGIYRKLDNARHTKVEVSKVR